MSITEVLKICLDISFVFWSPGLFGTVSDCFVAQSTVPLTSSLYISLGHASEVWEQLCKPAGHQTQRNVPPHQPGEVVSFGHGGWTHEVRGCQSFRAREGAPHICGQLNFCAALHTPGGQQVTAQPWHVWRRQCPKDPQLHHKLYLKRIAPSAGTGG